MSDHMRWAVLILVAYPMAMMAGYNHGSHNRKVQDRLDPVQWVIDAPTTIAIAGHSWTPIVKRYPTQSKCEVDMQEFARKNLLNFRPRCIEEGGQRSVWKENPWEDQ